MIIILGANLGDCGIINGVTRDLWGIYTIVSYPTEWLDFWHREVRSRSVLILNCVASQAM